jgi:hypothetical protein
MINREGDIVLCRVFAQTLIAKLMRCRDNSLVTLLEDGRADSCRNCFVL